MGPLPNRRQVPNKIAYMWRPYCLIRDLIRVPYRCSTSLCDATLDEKRTTPFPLRAGSARVDESVSFRLEVSSVGFGTRGRTARIRPPTSATSFLAAVCHAYPGHFTFRRLQAALWLHCASPFPRPLLPLQIVRLPTDKNSHL